MNYDDYSKACDKIRAKNSEYLNLFEQVLVDDGLKDSTIKRHLSTIDFYINDFLLYEEPLTMDYGIGKIDSFLGDFFIDFADFGLKVEKVNLALCSGNITLRRVSRLIVCGNLAVILAAGGKGKYEGNNAENADDFFHWYSSLIRL